MNYATIKKNGRGKRSRRESIAVCQRLNSIIARDALTVWPGIFSTDRLYTLETEQEILQALAPTISGLKAGAANLWNRRTVQRCFLW